MLRSILAIAVVLSLACSAGDEVPEFERWKVLSTATVDESESDYVALPTLAYAAADGDLFVSDVQQGAVWQLSREGRIVRKLGSRGSGPGEFRVPGRVAQIGDTVFVENTTRNRILKFNARTGHFVGEIEAPVHLEQLVVVDGALYTASKPDAEGRFLAPVNSSEFNAVALGRAPAVLRDDEMLAAAFGASATSVDGGQLLSVFQLSDSIYRTPLKDSLDGVLELEPESIPVRVRMGAKSDLVLRAKTDPEVAAKIVYGTSIPFAISGESARPRVLYYDPERVNGRMLGRYILAWRTAEGWCEGTVPVVNDPRPALALRGDTIFAISQSADSSETVRTHIQVILLARASECSA